MQYLNACTKTLHIVAPVHQMFLLETLSGFAVKAFHKMSLGERCFFISTK